MSLIKAHAQMAGRGGKLEEKTKLIGTPPPRRGYLKFSPDFNTEAWD